MLNYFKVVLEFGFVSSHVHLTFWGEILSTATYDFSFRSRFSLIFTLLGDLAGFLGKLTF